MLFLRPWTSNNSKTLAGGVMRFAVNSAVIAVANLSQTCWEGVRNGGDCDMIHINLIESLSRTHVTLSRLGSIRKVSNK